MTTKKDAIKEALEKLQALDDEIEYAANDWQQRLLEIRKLLKEV